MTAWWSGTGRAFLALPDERLLDALAHRALRTFRVNEAAQLRAWAAQAPILRGVLRSLPEPDDWQVLLEFEIPRLGGRIDAVLLSPRAVFVIEFKVDATRFENADREQLDGYALDLQDFHGGCRQHPILPILVATHAPLPMPALPFLLAGAGVVMDANAGSVAGLVRTLDMLPTTTRRPLDVVSWEHAPYRPVPNVIEAACKLYDRHSVAEIASARTDAVNLTLTADRIAALLAGARHARRRQILFVTGIPGAGKTLCGLNAAFTSGENPTEATFLTGNPTLVHVLRAALVRSVADTPGGRRAAAHRMEGVIQALPRFRDLYVSRAGECPPERIVVIDEAQRCWTAAHATAKTRDRPVRLDRSEPAHLLDIMARHDGFAAIVCLIGNGQEIHDGEGGLAAWGAALAERPDWEVHAPPPALVDPEPRNRLPVLPGLTAEPLLHLNVPVRSLRHDATPRWVDAVLRGDRNEACRIVADEGAVPFRLTRDLAALRNGLRTGARGGLHRAGLVGSSGASRLRAEGLGCELPHMDAEAVARWFLESWHLSRDVRASDALELIATQFSVQGLELDQVGLCWDGDLVREGTDRSWQVRNFRGTRWQVARDADKIAWRINTYRVLLTRARYETLIWVPRGDQDDPSRDPAVLDRVAEFLQACGVRPLSGDRPAGSADHPPSQPFLVAMDS